MLNGNTTMQLVTAGGYVAGGVAAGFLLRALFGWLGHRATRTHNAWDDLSWGLLRGMSVPAMTLLGIWGAATALSLPPGIRAAAEQVLLGVAVLAAALTVARAAGSVIGTLARERDGVAPSATIFVNLTRIVVLAIGILVLLQSLGISIAPLLTALGVGGLAVALALQDTLANLFAGIQILASNKVQPGDFISLDSGQDGKVVDINWRNTTIRQLSGNIVVVPNAHLADAIMTNYHQPTTDMSVIVQVGVAYDSDLEKVERITVEVAREVMREVPGAVPVHEPAVRYHTFGESSIDFSVVLRAADYTTQYVVKHEFIKRLHLRYRDEGVEIPFPVRRLVLPDLG